MQSRSNPIGMIPLLKNECALQVLSYLLVVRLTAPVHVPQVWVKPSLLIWHRPWHQGPQSPNS
jgi:hypothetical protein